MDTQNDAIFERRYILNTIIFGIYVRLRGGTIILKPECFGHFLGGIPVTWCFPNRRELVAMQCAQKNLYRNTCHVRRIEPHC